jgi:hypothetical protein
MFCSGITRNWEHELKRLLSQPSDIAFQSYRASAASFHSLAYSSLTSSGDCNHEIMLSPSKGLIHSLTRPICRQAYYTRPYLIRGVATTNEAPPNPPTAIRLREYQEECIQSVLSHLEKGHKRLGVSLATGSGKTVGIP